MIAGIHISQEIFANNILTTLKPSLEHDFTHVLRLLRLYGDQALEKQIEYWKWKAFISVHSLHEQSAWRFDYFLKINPKSNLFSMEQIKNEDLLELQACNQGECLHQDHWICLKVRKNMALTKLHVLLCAFTSKAETL